MNSIKSRNLLETIVDKYFDSVLIIGSNRDIVASNRSAQELFGLGSATVSFSTLITDEQQEPIDLAQFGQTHRLIRVQCMSTVGRKFVGLAHLIKSIVDEQTHYIAIIRDVTAQERFEEELRREAKSDSLTGLANRREFQRFLEDSLAQAVTLAIIDLDHFKMVNDNQGHVVGDDLMRWIADTFRFQFTDAVCISRLGGDEFGVLLTQTDVAQNRNSFQQLKETIESGSKAIAPGGITVSIGIATSSEDRNMARDLLIAADRALYRSKKEGRNAITFAD